MIRSIGFMCLAGLILTGAVSIQADVDVHVSANFNELNNYGEWVIVPEYGTVWRPDADEGWRPFMYGHWVYSNDGWAWDSDEDFGWIVCHYGNWYYDDTQGWVWIPGYDWSPARVRWHVTNNEIGWAPLFPELRKGYRHSTFTMQWTFVPVPYFTSYEVRNHVAVRAVPSVSRGYVYAGPPRRDFVQRKVREPIISINLDKVRMTTRERPLIRVQVERKERVRVEVPVGPKYRRTPVRSEREQQNSVPFIREETRQPLVRQENPDDHRTNVEERPASPEVKERARQGNDQDREGLNDENNEKKKKVRIEMKE